MTIGNEGSARGKMLTRAISQKIEEYTVIKNANY